MESSTYKELKCNISCVQSIEKFEMQCKLNEHVQVKLTAIIKEEEKDTYIEKVSEKKSLIVKKENDVIFNGMIKNATVEQEGGFYYLFVEGVSNTFQMDIQKKTRSFQNKSMTYLAMVKSILSDYESAHVIDTASEGETINTIQLQYFETDWNYIKRMASFFNAPLVPNYKLEGAKFYFGVPKGKNIGKIDDYEYSVSKNIEKYMKASQNGNKKIKEKDVINVSVKTDEEHEIGDYGTFNNVKMYIRKKTAKMNKGILQYRYEFSEKSGLTCSKLYNDKMVGVSMKGTVLERVRDHLKVHLEIDPSQDKATAWLFPYATMYASEGNSGWYCMPEEKDTVLVYFPDTDSKNAVATGSIRTQGSAGDKIDNPQVKYFRTADGKEVMFSPDEIIITCNDNEIFITLNQSDGITISSTENIKLHSDKEITIEAEEEIVVNAKEKIDIKCKSSHITMDGDIEIYGTEVRMN